MSQDMQALRAEIDAVDGQLVKLFEARMRLSRAVGTYKARHGLPITDPVREAQLLESRTAALEDPALAEGAMAFFQSLMAIGKAEQARIVETAPSTTFQVAYQGVPGAFGHEAVLRAFGEGATPLAFKRFEDVFLAVAQGQAALGTVPLENSSSGMVAENCDLLGTYGLFIVGETRLPVAQCLLGLPGATLEDIEEVYSHDQGFLQCATFLAGHEAWRRVPYFNTAMAARLVAESGDKHRAAIASRFAAAQYGLSVLCPDIHSHAGNTTRFVILSTQPLYEGNKASLLFTLKHQRGALHRALACFVALGANLTNIASRPMPGTPWEYRFYVDVEGDFTQKRLEVLTEALLADCTACRLLGCYPADKG